MTDDRGRDWKAATVFMNSDRRRKPLDEAGRSEAVPFERAPGVAVHSRRQATAQAPVLFLDDDPRRAENFLAETPHAVWVETSPIASIGSKRLGRSPSGSRPGGQAACQRGRSRLRDGGHPVDVQ